MKRLRRAALVVGLSLAVVITVAALALTIFLAGAWALS